MEESKFLEKHEILLTDKMKSASSHDKIKESVSSESSESKDSPILNHDKIPKREEKIPNAKQKLEVAESLDKSVEKSKDSLVDKLVSEAIPSFTTLEKDSRKLDEEKAIKEVAEAKEGPIQKEISLESVPRESKQEPKINDNTLKTEAESTAIQPEEPIPLKNPTETRAKKHIGTKKPPAAIKEKSGQDHRMKGETSKAAAQDYKKQPKAALLMTAKKQTPEEKKKKDMQEYVDGIQAMEEKKRIREEIEAREAETILKEEERRKHWKTLLTEVCQATSLSTFNSSFERSSTPRSVVVAILQRSAKQQYKRKLSILRENFNYRLGLLKQLKHDIKNNYRSEAQQLYFEYTSIKQKTQNPPKHIDTSDINLDFQESKVIVTRENPKDLPTLG